MADLSLRDRVIQRLLAASDAKLTAADVDDATSLRQDLDISSLILITLASELEDELGIDIDDEELRRAPSFRSDLDFDWGDRSQETELHRYYGTPPYWGGF